MSASRVQVGWMVGCALVILSAILGWRLQRATAALISKDGAILLLRAEVARTNDLQERTLAKLRAREAVGSSRQEAAAAARDSAARVQRETLDWIKRRGISLQVAPFNPVEIKLDLQLAILLGMTPSEYDRLNEALQQTKQHYDELAVHAAANHVGADGKTLEVTVPSLGADGDSLYTSLLNTFREVLGPERFQVFNAVAGEGFDTSFDRFGLDPVRYVLTLQPADQARNAPRYSVTRYVTDANGTSSSWSSGTYTRSDLEKGYPVLAHFLEARPDGKMPTTNGGN